MTTEWNLKPENIEERSFSIITEEAGAHSWNPDAWSIVQRLIHTSADFEYVNNTIISPGAIEAGIAAIMQGAPIITDTKMAMCGISSARLSRYGNRTTCLISDERTQKKARETGTTRALAAVDLAHDLFFRSSEEGGIWVVGNAPQLCLGFWKNWNRKKIALVPNLLWVCPWVL